MNRFNIVFSFLTLVVCLVVCMLVGLNLNLTNHETRLSFSGPPSAEKQAVIREIVQEVVGTYTVDQVRLEREKLEAEIIRRLNDAGFSAYLGEIRLG